MTTSAPRLKDIKRFYDEAALLYHHERTGQGRLFNEYIEMPATKALIEEKTLRRKRVLDIGCGTGIYSKYFLERGAHVTALDISENMLDMTRQHCQGFEKRLTLVRGSFERSAFNENSFDLVLGSFMLGYFRNLDTVYKKIHATLKPGGRSILSSIHPYKMQASSHTDTTYVYKIKDDCFNKKLYETDLGFQDKKIKLRIWELPDLVNKASDAGLRLDGVREPRPIPGTEALYPEAKLYHSCPSVLIVQHEKPRPG